MTLHVTPEYITSLKPNEIFVFGSNLAGMQGGVETIRPYVDEFIEYAKQHPDLAAEWIPRTEQTDVSVHAPRK